MTRDRSIAAWLFACCALVVLMIVVGGITRLTHSGLSIVEWQPLVGAIPPLSDADWITLFEKYKQTPEYQRVNAGMALDGFKGIFWWEYLHRLLGRLIGVAFLVPYLWFLARGAIRGSLAWKLGAIFVLGGLQGAMGWYMVKSGLVDDPRVSHFRLTAHLGLAFLILAAMLWVALGLLHPRMRAAGDRMDRMARGLAHGTAFLVFFMVLTGGLVAGLRAGKAYNTFPLMNGHWIPPEILQLEPWWKNVFWNIATVQFDHRLGAWLLAIVVPLLWWRCRNSEAKLAASVLLALVVLQIALGISTLLLAVPVTLGVLHQGVASLVLCAAIWTMQTLRGPVVA